MLNHQGVCSTCFGLLCVKSQPCKTLEQSDESEGRDLQTAMCLAAPLSLAGVAWKWARRRVDMSLCFGPLLTARQAELFQA